MPFDPLIDAGYKHGEFSRGPSAGLRVELQDHHSYRDSTPGPCRIDLVQCDAVLRAVTKCKSFRIVSQTILITLTQRMIPLQQGLYLSVERHSTFDLVYLQDPFRWQPGVEHHG